MHLHLPWYLLLRLLQHLHRLHLQLLLLLYLQLPSLLHLLWVAASAVPSTEPTAVPNAVPSATSAGLVRFDQLSLTKEESRAIHSPQAPPIPPGLFWGVQPMGHGKGGDDGLQTCRACCAKCSKCLVRCTAAHKGKEKQCDPFAQQLKVWQSWYSCNGCRWCQSK